MAIKHRIVIAGLVTSLSLFSAACTAQGEIDDSGIEAEIEGNDNGGDEG